MSKKMELFDYVRFRGKDQNAVFKIVDVYMDGITLCLENCWGGLFTVKRTEVCFAYKKEDR